MKKIGIKTISTKNSETKSRLEAESKINENRAEAIAKKKSDLAAELEAANKKEEEVVAETNEETPDTKEEGTELNEETKE